ncbi:hypothetical protein FKW77_006597 [Venturia effusa]|uniref:Uncharacterized protein n=1 Tax=Venturia effusa TaxID=50376 RepID=A0A517LE03_9PEZI|nr:hypothetical protein FKW77_006597 [Venturia effusa]
MSAHQPEGPDLPERLSSNVMNYLVWRYLQEAGYGKTAKQLQYQWVGTTETPESLPFVANIKKGCLIHLAQDGLFLDQLQAEVKKTQRQYNFGFDHGPKFSVPAEEPRTSSGRDTSRKPNHSERETPKAGSVEPSKPKKGKRKSAGSERRMNGDMMDVDVGGIGPTSIMDPTVAEAESPRPAVEEPIEPTLSIGLSQEVATEAPRDLNPDTSFLPHEGTTLEFVKWCPDNSTALLVAGENHMRAYRVASDVSEQQAESNNWNIHVDEEDYRVQAFCWTEKSSAVFSTAREYTNEIGDSIPQNRLFGFTDYGTEPSSMQLVDPLAGTIVALRYNAASKLLLSISHGEQAVIKIWRYSQAEPEAGSKLKEASFEFLLDKVVGAEIYDAAWTTNYRFLVCGMNTLQLYEVGEDIDLIKAFGTEQDWFRMQYDPLCEVAALSDDEMHALGVVKLDGDLKIHNETFQNTTLTDFAFQPIVNKDSYQEGSPRLLATSSANGQVRIWNALGPLVCLHELSLGVQAAAMVVSFSPDGFLLAAAGYDTLHVWKADEGGEPKAVWHMPAPNDRWNSVPQEEPEEKEPLAWLHTLSWDSDGKKIAFGLKDQVAVIRLRPTESDR